MKKLEILNKINDLTTKLSQNGKYFYQDYEEDLANKYICDLISEYADSLIDLYSRDLTNWVAECSSSLEYIERALKELGPFDDGESLIKSAQYLYYTDEIYNDCDLLEEIKELKEELEELEE